MVRSSLFRPLGCRSSGPLLAAVLTCATLAPAVSHAQLPTVELPDASPAASRTQMIGRTTIAVHWNRPAVREREIWGALVPWDQVWRAGANKNTLLHTDGPIRVGGSPTTPGLELAAGSYGVHLIPRQNAPWTVILSRQTKAWGSVGYDPSEDALRVDVTPRTVPFEERLDLRFDEVTDRSAEFALRWQAVEVAVPLAIDFPGSVLADLRGQLRGRAQFGWVGFHQAAKWSFDNGGDLSEALAWVDQSLQRARTFTNLRTKAAIVDKIAGDGAATSAAALREEALTVGSEAELVRLGNELATGGDHAEALRVLRKNIDLRPTSASAYAALAELQVKASDPRQARVNYQRAIKLAVDPAAKERFTAALAALPR